MMEEERFVLPSRQSVSVVALIPRDFIPGYLRFARGVFQTLLLPEVTHRPWTAATGCRPEGNCRILRADAERPDTKKGVNLNEIDS